MNTNPLQFGSAVDPAMLTNDLRDIRPPVEIPNPWLWVALALGLVALVAGAFWLVRWWKLRASMPPVVPRIPPQVRARQKLNEALRFIEEPRTFCFLVSDALRIYLEERFQLRAPERTTEEFLEELKTSAVLKTEQKETLSHFLSQCDLVKFARHEPAQNELEALHRTAGRLVDETEVAEATEQTSGRDLAAA